MKSFTISASILLVCTLVHAQDTLKLRATAQLVCDAVLREEFATVINYTYPKMVQMGGGDAKMIALCENGIEEMKQNGITIRSIELGSVGNVFKAGKELHCTISEIFSLSIKGGYLTSRSALLCISSDEGKNWTFIDAGSLNKSKFNTFSRL